MTLSTLPRSPVSGCDVAIVGAGAAGIAAAIAARRASDLDVVLFEGAKELFAYYVRNGPAYHVLAFSAPNVDELTGEFGMEIRIGYEHGPDGVRPLTGGSVTGNLFEALADIRLSSETRTNTMYAGPVAIRFGSLQVAGQD